MLRRASRGLLRFDQLLCGHVVHDAALHVHACEAAVQRFRALAPRTTPLPVPLAARMVAALVRDGRCNEAVRCVATHPRPGDVMCGVAAVLYTTRRGEADEQGRIQQQQLHGQQEQALRERTQASPPRPYEAHVWQLLHELRRTGVAGTVALLTAMAHHYSSSSSRCDDGGGDGVATAHGATTSCVARQRQQLRRAMMQHIDYHPHDAAALLRPLCLVSMRCCCDSDDDDNSASSRRSSDAATAHASVVRDDVLRVVDLALRDAGGMNADDVAFVLELLVQRDTTPPAATAATSAGGQTTAAVAAADGRDGVVVAAADNNNNSDDDVTARHVRYCRKAVALWGWAEHTAACGDARAVSAVVRAYAALRRLDDAIASVQRLNEYGGGDVDTTAQAAIVALCATAQPPLCRYADQLVAHWQPDAQALWAGDAGAESVSDSDSGGGGAQQVARAQLVLHARCRNDRRLLELMTQAHAVLRTRARACDALLRSPDMPPVLLRCFYAAQAATTGVDDDAATAASLSSSAAAAATRAMMADMLFARILSLPDLAAHPLLLGVAVLAGQHLRRLDEVWRVLDALDVSRDAATTLLCFLAEQRLGAVRKAATATTATTATTTRDAVASRLSLLNDVATHVRCEVPAEVRVWLDLLQ